MGCSPKVIRVPASAPAVTTSWWAARPFLTLAGAVPPTGAPTPRGAATSRDRAPANRSRLITPTTVNTKIHSSTRNPMRATVRTKSSDNVLAVHSERQGGRSELNHVTRVERDSGHPLSVDHRAVRRAQIGQSDLAAVVVQPGVPAGDPHVGQAQIRLVTAADHGRPDGQRVRPAVVGDQPYRPPATGRAADRPTRLLGTVALLLVVRRVGRGRGPLGGMPPGGPPPRVDLPGHPGHARVQTRPAPHLAGHLPVDRPALPPHGLSPGLG